jgi:type IV pilus assembly protein PilP
MLSKRFLLFLAISFSISFAHAQSPVPPQGPPGTGAPPQFGAPPGTAGPQGAPTPPAGPPTAAKPDESGSSSMFAGYMDPFTYDPQSRADPFVMPVPDKQMAQGGVHGPLLPLQRFELSQLSLVGIIWDVRRPKAMIRDPEMHTHIVGPNTKVGPRNGYIAVIREGEIVVVETEERDSQLVSTAQVVKIAK